MTNKDFDFNNVGKRMPYTVPDGFFAEMEREIMCKAKTDGQPAVKRKRTMMRVMIGGLITAAASVAVFLTVNMGQADGGQSSMSDVEQAFAQLSSSDQAYLLEVYQDDVFFNE